MNSSSRGNKPNEWDAFLTALDDKLQLGLLRKLEGVRSYHFEDDILYIEVGSAKDYDYLSENAHFQQLEILAQATLKVDRVKIKQPADD